MVQKKDIDWQSLGFAYQPTDYSYVSNYKDGAWDEGGLTPDHTVTLSECAGLLHYCQEVFEGLKAYTTKDGRVVCFRPDQNAHRMHDSAERIVMPPFPEDRFVEAVDEVVRANAAWVPPFGTGAMFYIRPLMFATGNVIGVKPADEYQFRILGTGFYTSKAKAQAHLNAGAKKVVISAPAGNDLKTIVYNVNHETLTADDDIISAASCTTNCLAPMAKGLNDYAPIVSGIMTTIHAYTGDQMILDGPQRKGNFRRSRAGAENIVPNTTGAAKAIGLVLPELNGKLIGAAQRVPTPTGSLTNLYAVVNKEVTVEGVNAAMKAYSEQIPETFGYNEDQIVSRDIVGMTYGSLFDATQTMVNPLGNGQSLVQVTSWYDNENSFTSQMVRTIKYFEKFVA
jgi:glyceraldehyde 3-phosphate dehydrogenase